MAMSTANCAPWCIGRPDARTSMRGRVQITKFHVGAHRPSCLAPNACQCSFWSRRLSLQPFRPGACSDDVRKRSPTLASGLRQLEWQKQSLAHDSPEQRGENLEFGFCGTTSQDVARSRSRMRTKWAWSAAHDLGKCNRLPKMVFGSGRREVLLGPC